MGRKVRKTLNIDAEKLKRAREYRSPIGAGANVRIMELGVGQSSGIGVKT
jgi:hypothetical protein